MIVQGNLQEVEKGTGRRVGNEIRTGIRKGTVIGIGIGIETGIGNETETKRDLVIEIEIMIVIEIGIRIGLTKVTATEIERMMMIITEVEIVIGNIFNLWLSAFLSLNFASSVFPKQL